MIGLHSHNITIFFFLKYKLCEHIIYLIEYGIIEKTSYLKIKK